jgi:hypothetical protein
MSEKLKSLGFGSGMREGFTIIQPVEKAPTKLIRELTAVAISTAEGKRGPVPATVVDAETCFKENSGRVWMLVSV